MPCLSFSGGPVLEGDPERPAEESDQQPVAHPRVQLQRGHGPAEGQTTGQHLGQSAGAVGTVPSRQGRHQGSMQRTCVVYRVDLPTATDSP